MRRRDISKTLFAATATGMAGILSKAEAQSCSAPCYAQTAAESAAGVAPVNTAYEPGNIVRYGASTSAANNQPEIQAAINQAVQTGGAPVRIPCGTWTYTSTLIIPAPCEFRGDDQYTAILMKNGNFVGISITDGGSGQYAQAYLQGFTLTSAGGDSSDGLQINTIGRIRCARLFISNHGGHGLEIVQGSVGRYDDITSTGNAGDGFRLTGSGPVQANANVFTNIDTRGNGGWGFNLLTAMTNMGTGVTCQSNTAGGIQLGACFCNRLDVYCESNSGPDISFTTACAVPYGGNLIYAVYLDKAPVYNGSSGTGNAVYTNRSGPVYQPAISQLIADLVTFSNTRTDGTTPDGTFSIVHNNNLELDVIAGAYSAHQKTVFSNSQHRDTCTECKPIISLPLEPRSLGGRECFLWEVQPLLAPRRAQRLRCRPIQRGTCNFIWGIRRSRSPITTIEVVRIDAC
jgi:hypothetical protein